MTDHARPPEGVETWTVWVCPTHGVVMPGSPWSVEHDDELIHTPTVPCNRICLEVEVVRLSAFLAEREARERAESALRTTADERDKLKDERAYLADQISWEPGRKDEMGDEITPVDDALSIMGELGRERDVADPDRDAAVARAEQAEKDVEKLIADYRAALDDAKREYERAEQAEAERDEARKALRELVSFKDGPHGGAYQAAEDHAWDRARAALSPDPSGEGDTVN